VKFLVIWKLELSLLSPHVAAAVARMPAYAQPLEKSGQVAASTTSSARTAAPGSTTSARTRNSSG
jgi:hypothetical protein